MLRNILGSRLVQSARQKFTSDERDNRAADVVRLPVGKRLPEKRSSGYTVNGNLTDNIGMFLEMNASSGVSVNERTALNVAAVTACVRLLADMVAKLPIYLYRDTPKGPQEITDHPGAMLMAKSPSEMHTSFELRQLMETGKGLNGNGYARVYRDAYGDPRSIQWLEPNEVTTRMIKRGNGEKMIVYHVDGLPEALSRYEIIHVRGFSRDGYTGLSPVRLLRESIGNALTQTSAAGELMKNGARFPGVLSTDQVLKPDQLLGMKEEWQRNTTNGKLGSTPILHGGLKFLATSGMSMVDAQFLESRRFELQDIARFYGIPPFMIGDSTASTTWGTGIEQQTLGFLNFSLDPHLIGWEQSLGHTLLTTEEQRQGLYFKFDRDQLANVALEARAAFYTAMRNAGVYSPNDVRRKENEPLISKEDGGDSYANPNIKQPTPPTAQPATV